MSDKPPVTLERKCAVCDAVTAKVWGTAAFAQGFYNRPCDCFFKWGTSYLEVY